MDWFRFYSETIHDTKIRRVARKAKESPVHVIGVWAVLLSMASESPQRGALMVSDGVPVTVDDIEDVIGCNVSETLHEMVQVGMLAIDGDCYVIPAWDKRQFASDNSTPRVNKHRNKVKQETETFLKRFGNAPDTDTDTDTDTEAEAERRNATIADFQEQMTRQYESVLGMIPTASYPEMIGYMRKLQEREVMGWWGMALTETTQAQRPGWHYMKAIIEAWLAAGVPSIKRTNGTDPTKRRGAPSEFTPEQIAAADARQAAYEQQIAAELERAGKL